MTTGETIRSYLALGKLKISFFAALSAATGLFLANRSPGGVLPVLIAGVFLLACGACSLNQYQERGSDALMARTAGRPLPAGRVKPGHALCFSLALIGSGSLILLFTGSLAAPLLGLGAVLWYNGFYTWIKARTAFAALPGALAGAIPPAIGWMAGGGDLGQLPLAVLCFFFFMWQVPHFFVHLLTFGTEYEAIGRPSLTAVFTGVQLGRLVSQWLFASAVSLQLIIVCGLLRSPFVRIALLTASFWLVARGVHLLREGKPGYPRVFKELNYFMLAVMLLLFLDKLPGYLG
jgi:protoheme IX farnesyltransferase